MMIHMDLGESSYDITVERGALDTIGDLADLDRKVLIVTDSGVPGAVADIISSSSSEPFTVRIPEGEESKNFDSYRLLLRTLVENGFTRSDCVVAAGGGMVGDLAGFAAATYMRGIDFYNVPTTLLSQIDSSIGGKVAIDFEGYKNMAGAFYQPEAVIIDPDVLETLPERHMASGMAEAVKMAMTSDEDLLQIIERGRDDDLDTIIERSLLIKKAVVEEDEKETGLRKILNFGHTIGHGIESAAGGSLYHGECVALGMMYMTEGAARERLRRVLLQHHLPAETEMDTDSVMDAISHDKKFRGDRAALIKVKEPGSWIMEEGSLGDIRTLLEERK